MSDAYWAIYPDEAREMEVDTYPHIRLTRLDRLVNYPTKVSKMYLKENGYTAMYMVEVVYPKYDNRDAYCGCRYSYTRVNTLEEAMKIAETYPTWSDPYPEDPSPAIVFGNLGWALHQMTKAENYISKAWVKLIESAKNENTDYEDPFSDE